MKSFSVLFFYPFSAAYLGHINEINSIIRNCCYILLGTTKKCDKTVLGHIVPRTSLISFFYLKDLWSLYPAHSNEHVCLLWVSIMSALRASWTLWTFYVNQDVHPSDHRGKHSWIHLPSQAQRDTITYWETILPAEREQQQSHKAIKITAGRAYMVEKKQHPQSPSLSWSKAAKLISPSLNLICGWLRAASDVFQPEVMDNN